MKTYLQLLADRAELDAQIAKARKAYQAEGIEAVRKVIADFNLTPKEVFGRGKAKAKYRAPLTGREWSGRGREPAWIRGWNRELFLIKD